MSNEPKCPICGGDLIKGENFPWFYSCQSTNWKSEADKLCELDDCAASVPVWETLRRTRKALDVAVDALKEYADRDNWGMGFAPWLEDGFKDALYTEDGYKTAEKALEQITELEQKEYIMFGWLLFGTMTDFFNKPPALPKDILKPKKRQTKQKDK